jgi:hypothetical protein
MHILQWNLHHQDLLDEAPQQSLQKIHHTFLRLDLESLVQEAHVIKEKASHLSYHMEVCLFVAHSWMHTFFLPRRQEGHLML